MPLMDVGGEYVNNDPMNKTDPKGLCSEGVPVCIPSPGIPPAAVGPAVSAGIAAIAAGGAVAVDGVAAGVAAVGLALVAALMGYMIYNSIWEEWSGDSQVHHAAPGTTIPACDPSELELTTDGQVVHSPPGKGLPSLVKNWTNSELERVGTDREVSLRNRALRVEPGNDWLVRIPG